MAVHVILESSVAKFIYSCGSREGLNFLIIDLLIVRQSVWLWPRGWLCRLGGLRGEARDQGRKSQEGGQEGPYVGEGLRSRPGSKYVTFCTI